MGAPGVTLSSQATPSPTRMAARAVSPRDSGAMPVTRAWLSTPVGVTVMGPQSAGLPTASKMTGVPGGELFSTLSAWTVYAYVPLP